MISASAEWANRSGGVAIIGMAGRFPGADDVEAFWRNLRAGVESIRFFSEAELRAAGVSPRRYADPSYLPASGFLPGIEQFDAGFFGFTPREAQITDPQHRLFLESAWTALESAGYDPKRFSGLIGVYAGCGKSEYLWRHVCPHFEAQGDSDDFQLLVASDKDFLSTRVSYKLDLHGPSLTVQTACSTALVAICMAWQSLLTFQCDLALAGGVSVDLQGRYGHLHREGMIMSPDGHCRAFDEKAQGTVGGDGVGVIVLKRLEDALAKGDHVYAVIKGAALNNDGSSKVGYTAPSIAGQTQVIAQALAIADIAPSTVSYIEAHGTGTPLGDPIEIAALSEVFAGVPRGSCAIGSVKTNIGHLNSAAGVAGLIKTVQALRYRELPPSLHFTTPNPKLNLASSPFFVNTRLRPWTASPRRAGVSSFGIGGTNAHVVLEAAPPPGPTGPARPFQLLTLSAKTATALDAATANLAAALSASPPLPLPEVAYTLHVGRQQFSHRAFAVCSDTAQACQALRATGAEKLKARCTQTESEVVFLFPGGGAQYPNMGRELYDKESLYREEVDRCALLLLPVLGFDIRAELYPRAAEPRAAGERLQRIELALVTLFITEYALAQLWQSFGVTPKALIGHSLGEYTAACLAGVFSLEDALRLVASRGRLMARLPQGAMLSVQLPVAELPADLGEELSLAAVNGPASCVLSGSVAAVGRLEEALRQRDVSCHRLHIAVGAHSALVQPILAEFTREVAALRLRPPRLPFISNVSGTWIRPEEATSAEYWARHLRQTVRFGDGLAVLLADSPRIFLEVGPGHTLRGLLSQHPARLPEHTVLSSMRHPEAQLSDVAFLLETVGKLWLTGGTIDWEGFHRGEKRRRVPLPTYPFERQGFWIEAPARSAAAAGSRVTASGAAASRDWFYRPAWRLTANLPEVPGAAHWLIFSDGASAAGAVGAGWGDSVARLLAARGHRVAVVEPGDRFARRPDGVYTVQAHHRADYESLLRELEQLQLYPQRILHLWNLIALPDLQLEAELSFSFYSPLALAQALASRPPGCEPLTLTLVTGGLQRVADEPTRRPSQAAALGPCRVLPREYEFLRCRLVDLECGPEAAAGQQTPVSVLSPSEPAMRQLVAECSADTADCVIAYRQGERWVQTFEPTTLPAPAAAGPRLRQRGVYLITGGLGGIGLELASYLAQAVSARLILIGRTPAGPAANERVKALEALGAEVFCGVADVADVVAMRAVLAAAGARFGTLAGLGVIHAAGIAGGGAVHSRTVDAHRAVLRPKLHGTLVLDELVRELRPDFFILCSSLNALVSRFGQADYCAANAFLDAFAHHKKGRRATVYTSINWDAWREVGIAARAGSRLIDLASSLTSKDGVAAFQQCLASGLPQVAISTEPLLQRLHAGRAEAEPAAAAALTPVVTAFPRPTLQNPYVAPRTEHERVLCGIFQSLLGIEPVGITDSFQELGGDSLMAVALLARVRALLKLRLPAYQLLDTPTVAELAVAIAGPGSAPAREPTDSPLVALRAASGARRASLFLMHPGGGHIHIYRDLTQALGSEQPVYALQSPAVDGRSPPLGTIEEMAASYLLAIRAVQPAGPYALGGASLGGMIAYEMARQLTAAGQRVGLLTMFDTAGPGQLPPPLKDDAEILAYMMHMGGDKDVSVAALRQLSPAEQWQLYWTRSQVFHRLIPQVVQAQQRILSHVWKANVQAMLQYEPQPCSSRILFFLARDKDPYNSPTPEQSWLPLARAGIELYEVPGNHITMNYAPHVQVIADRLRPYLDAL